MSGRTRMAVVAGAVLAAAGFAVLSAAPAWAHAEPIGVAPADGSTVDSSPPAAEIRLTEPVETAATKVSLVDGAGHTLPTGPAALLRTAGAGPEEPVTLRIPLPVLPPDAYRLSWTTVSSDDLHPTAGTLVFGVQRAVAPATAGPPADPLPGAGEVLAQAAVYLGLGGWIGSMVLLFLRRPPDGPARRVRARLLRTGAVAAVAAFFGGLALMLVRAAVFGSDVVPLAWQLVSGTTAGPPWVIREAVALGMAALSVTALRRGSLPRRPVAAAVLVLASAGAGTTALLGHLGRSGPLLLATDVLHILATMTWAGTVLVAGVVLVGLRGHREQARAILRRFGLVATGALTVLVATGLLLAGDRVASLDALLLSTYGRILLLKAGLVAVAALAGLVTTRSLHGRTQDPARTRPAVRAETVVLAGVLVVTAGLVSTHQATGAQWRPPGPVVAQNSLTADDLIGTVDVRPNLPGRNFVTVSLFDTRRPAPAPIRAVDVVLRGPGGAAVTRTASPAGPGAYLLATDDLADSGNWTISVTAHRPGLAPATATLPWEVPPPAAFTRPTVFSDAPLTGYTAWPAALALLVGAAALRLLTGRGTRRARQAEKVPVP
ncbi:copper resistance protein CopC [Amycolatopsis mongoliensis]|uniref:Copper resistance protein CopC n=1 Tax=Amycolatopsis mongoliensis TaxID=715475 RepID=A0A9Y2JHG5_9PSEU|nr:copper resistance protein CopC [Amycolatopsis sp. 4-36]WIX98557.1 copper resistance protein CopC [Amycolatopsis sp. 4-36]